MYQQLYKVLVALHCPCPYDIDHSASSTLLRASCKCSCSCWCAWPKICTDLEKMAHIYICHICRFLHLCLKGRKNKSSGMSVTLGLRLLGKNFFACLTLIEFCLRLANDIWRQIRGPTFLLKIFSDKIKLRWKLARWYLEDKSGGQHFCCLKLAKVELGWRLAGWILEEKTGTSFVVEIFSVKIESCWRKNQGANCDIKNILSQDRMMMVARQDYVGAG